MIPETSYSNKFASIEQVEWEERIAAHLFDTYRDSSFDEHDAQQAGRDVLKMILHKFRIDLFTTQTETSYFPGQRKKD